ncbi:MAG TPA: hypothetical protein VG078_02695, partial [Acidimicrobiales bacterium]|nr:hypothetical protein [Acidimicrobiales bacterium]
LRARPGWGRLGTWSVMWTEYYGQPLRRCSDLPHVSATFSVPRADGDVVTGRDQGAQGAGGDLGRAQVGETQGVPTEWGR